MRQLLLDLLSAVIKNNLTEIEVLIVVFLAGVGMGSAVTDAINRWGCENEKHNDSDT